LKSIFWDPNFLPFEASGRIKGIDSFEFDDTVFPVRPERFDLEFF
jgi:hypothetical protein